MKEKKYVVVSDEGAVFASMRGSGSFSAEVGQVVSLELDDEKQEQALIAAAWLRDAKEKEG